MLCLRCSGAHRSLGVAVSKVRSATLDSWTEETIAHMQTIGNAKSNAVYEACLDKHPEGTRPAHPSQEEANTFVELKYVQKRFASPPPAEDADEAEGGEGEEGEEGVGAEKEDDDETAVDEEREQELPAGGAGADADAGAEREKEEAVAGGDI